MSDIHPSASNQHQASKSLILKLLFVLTLRS